MTGMPPPDGCEDRHVDLKNVEVIRAFWLSWITWILVTVLSICAVVGLYFLLGLSWQTMPIQPGPHSDLRLTFLSVAVVWVLGGGCLFLLQKGIINSRNAVDFGCFLLVALLYIGILRERTAYGDVQDYVLAAVNLVHGEPLHARYVYPPLWGFLLSYLLVFGERIVFDVCWLLNYFALLLNFYLLRRVLIVYGYPSVWASIVVALFMCVNVPLLRTLGFVQINLHVLNAILASLVFYRKHSAWSAAALSLAGFLKFSPFVLAVAFVWRRDWRWMGWFLGWCVVIGVLPILQFGISPYGNFITNVGQIHDANGIQFRDFSFDSFFRTLWVLCGLRTDSWLIWTMLAKVGLIGICGHIFFRVIKYRVFVQAEESAMLNALPLLLVFMTLFSPLIWPHHGIFLAIPFLVLLKWVPDVQLAMILGGAYALVFVMPVFDVFPLSHARLVGAGLLLYLMWQCGRPGTDTLPLLDRLIGLEKLEDIHSRRGDVAK